MELTCKNKEMAEVYSHIYDDYYNLTPSAMQEAQQNIGKNLLEMGISKEIFTTMDVLNIGTGRETAVLHFLGAKEVYHYDISERAFQTVSKLIDHGPAFQNIHTCRIDFCTESLPIAGPIDFVYLNGVFHHLHSPDQAVRNIFGMLGKNPKLFFRIYRSGSFCFFVVDFIRKFINYDDRDMVSDLFRSKFGNHELATVLYNDMYDDFFAPVLRLYDPVTVDEFFTINGFRSLNQQPFPEYNHNSNLNSGEGWSLMYEATSWHYDTGAIPPFPPHVDQMRDICYREATILDTIATMSIFLEKVRDMAPELRAATALDLYAQSRLRYCRDDLTLEERHDRLRKTLTF